MRINPYKYPFIAIEGIDGCGKSTLIEDLKKWDKEKGLGAIFTREPTDGEIGQRIRRIINNKGCDDQGNKVSAKDLQRLYICDSLNHRQNEAIFLEQYPIFSDRDRFSMVYGVAGGVDAHQLLREHENILGEYFFIPDLVLILDLNSEKAIRRIEKTNKKADYFEKLDFLEKVRDAYLAFPRVIKKAYPDVNLNIEYIDASQSIDHVFGESLVAINQIFAKKRLLGY